MARADEGQGPDAPKETAGSVSGNPVSHIEGPVIVVEPLQSVLLAEGSKDPEFSLVQPSLEGIKDKSRSNPFFYFLFFSKVLCCNGAFLE